MHTIDIRLPSEQRAEIKGGMFFVKTKHENKCTLLQDFGQIAMIQLCGLE